MASLSGETVSYTIKITYPDSTGFYQTSTIKSGTFVVGGTVELSQSFRYDYKDQYGYNQFVDGTVSVDFTGSACPL